MKPPRLNPNSPDFNQQLQHHLDLIWQALEDAKGIGGKTVKILGPLDMSGLPILNTPKAHKTSHQDGGTDEINVAGLSGLLADSQTPLSHGNEKHDSPFILHSLATALNDFLVASGSGAFVKKTLTEAQAILGVGGGGDYNLDGGAPDTVYSETTPVDGGTP